jgi:glycosyltransferase involved in cell wall biosynthesis
MRIAQIAPLAESVPPQLYGGTERIVSYLTEELVRCGHQVTLFASGDSETSAELVAITPRALRLDPTVIDPLAHSMVLLERLAAQAGRFDVVHFHFDHMQYGFMRRLDVPSVATMHGRMDLPDLVPLFREYAEIPLVSISDAQRQPLPALNWVATVPHGLPMETIGFYPGRGGYLAFLGRISPEKRLDRAIEIAGRSGWPLRVAAKVDPVDQEYFDREIRHLITGKVDFIGEIGEQEKDDFLGNAAAVLFPIDWPEPFGLVMIEAMARGTPVLAFRHGSVPEVIDEDETGVVVDSVDEAVAAMPRLLELDRRRVRATTERRFSVAGMADRYLDVYQRLIEAGGVTSGARPASGDMAASARGRLPDVQPSPSPGEATAHD